MATNFLFSSDRTTLYKILSTSWCPAYTSERCALAGIFTMANVSSDLRGRTAAETRTDFFPKKTASAWYWNTTNCKSINKMEESISNLFATTVSLLTITAGWFIIRGWESFKSQADGVHIYRNWNNPRAVVMATPFTSGGWKWTYPKGASMQFCYVLCVCFCWVRFQVFWGGRI